MGLTFNTIVFNTINEANLFITQINKCKGFPTSDNETITWQETPYELCRFSEGGSSLFLGYAVIVKNQILDCMTEIQKTEILTPEANIELCSYPTPSPTPTLTND
jgi:hypothetical protein